MYLFNFLYKHLTSQPRRSGIWSTSHGNYLEPVCA